MNAEQEMEIRCLVSNGGCRIKEILKELWDIGDGGSCALMDVLKFKLKKEQIDNICSHKATGKRK